MTETGCDQCGTDHDGHQPGSLGAAMHCMRIRAAAFGPVSSQVAALQSEVDLRVDRVVRAHFAASR